MTNYQSNSNRDKASGEPEKQRDKPVAVVTGEVVVKKKPLGGRIKDLFFSGDARDAVRYVIMDVAIPAAKNALYDMMVEGGRSIIFGPNGRGRGVGRYNEQRSIISYNDYSKPLIDQRSRVNLPDQASRQIFSRPSRPEQLEFVIPDKDQAEEVLSRMVEITSTHKYATVGDLYAMLGLKSDHTDEKWGWFTISNAELRGVREGWLLRFPPAEPV